MQRLRLLVAAASLAALTGVAEAAFVRQLNGLEVLDESNNLLWLFDWSSSGLNDWQEAQVWAAGLTVGGATAGEWRLPAIGEFQALWADFGRGLSGLQGTFDIESRDYWSGTEVVQSLGADAWLFGTGYGGPYAAAKYNPLYAPAVRDGVIFAAVPEPQSYALMLMGVGVVMLALRRWPERAPGRGVNP
jgi:hypothetical protein